MVAIPRIGGLGGGAVGGVPTVGGAHTVGLEMMQVVGSIGVALVGIPVTPLNSMLPVDKALRAQLHRTKQAQYRWPTPQG